ncbi:hypothetical protein BH10PSE17_BH10PSE17_10620 [soil metagenome]
MRVLGIELHKPTFLSLTVAAALAVTLWLVFLVMVGDTGPGGGSAIEAGKALVAISWGCLCTTLGLRFRKVSELMVYAGGCALLLVAYQGVTTYIV